MFFLIPIFSAIAATAATSTATTVGSAIVAGAAAGLTAKGISDKVKADNIRHDADSRYEDACDKLREEKHKAASDRNEFEAEKKHSNDEIKRAAETFSKSCRKGEGRV